MHLGNTRAVVALVLAALLCCAPVAAEGVFGSAKPERAAKKRAAKKKATAKKKAAAKRRAAERRAAKRRRARQHRVRAPGASLAPTSPLVPSSFWRPDPPPPSARPFSPNSFWNQPLPTDAPLDPLSSVYVDDLQRQLTLRAPWINTSTYGIPVYRVPRDRPTVRVALPNPTPPRRALLQAAWEAVPIPPDARPSFDSDGRLVIWQPSTDTMWEFWRARKRARRAGTRRSAAG